MTTATELAMNIADLRLKLRQLAGPFAGNHQRFDSAIRRAADAMSHAIIESIEAVGTPGIKPIHRRQNHSAQWLKKKSLNLGLKGGKHPSLSEMDGERQ